MTKTAKPRAGLIDEFSAIAKQLVSATPACGRQVRSAAFFLLRAVLASNSYQGPVQILARSRLDQGRHINTLIIGKPRLANNIFVRELDAEPSESLFNRLVNAESSKCLPGGLERLTSDCRTVVSTMAVASHDRRFRPNCETTRSPRDASSQIATACSPRSSGSPKSPCVGH
jgi:hypothetical protein